MDEYDDYEHIAAETYMYSIQTFLTYEISYLLDIKLTTTELTQTSSDDLHIL